MLSVPKFLTEAAYAAEQMLAPGQIAQRWLENCYVLDTETTGLDDHAEIVEISVIDQAGAVVLDTLVKPVNPIPADATAIHGITNEMVRNAPTWDQVHAQVIQLFTERPVVIYNAEYDTRLIEQSAARYNLLDDDLVECLNSNFNCAMMEYAYFWGECRSDGEPKWQRLTNAAAQQGVEIEGEAHRALCDCKTTLGVIKAMAAA